MFDQNWLSADQCRAWFVECARRRIWPQHSPEGRECLGDLYAQDHPGETRLDAETLVRLARGLASAFSKANNKNARPRKRKPGSGHHRHAGRPGEVGGSQPLQGGKWGATAYLDRCCADPEKRRAIPPPRVIADVLGCSASGVRGAFQRKRRQGWRLEEKQDGTFEAFPPEESSPRQRRDSNGATQRIEWRLEWFERSMPPMGDGGWKQKADNGSEGKLRDRYGFLKKLSAKGEIGNVRLMMRMVTEWQIVEVA